MIYWAIDEEGMKLACGFQSYNNILVLDGGHIIEDGTYDELLEKKGFFAELVARQRVE